MYFHYSCFRMSVALFQYHEEHQYPICDHGRSRHAGLLSCTRSFTDSSHHFDSRDYKLRPLMECHSENMRAHLCFLFDAFFIYMAIHRNTTPIYRVTCIALNGRMIVCVELDRMWEKVFMVSVKCINQTFSL
jgi:hypothetical protein